MAIEINDWSDWFEMCGGAVEDTKAYERGVRSYLELMDDRDAARVDADYAQNHSSAFWKADRPVTRACLVHAAKRAGVAAAIVMAAAVALWAVRLAAPLAAQYASLLTGGAFDVSGVDANVLDAVVGAILPVLAVAVAVAALSVVAFVLRRAAVTSRLARLEGTLVPVMAYVPPAYRNSFCLSAFSELWRSFGIGTMAQALDVCDTHIANNEKAGAYVPITILYDVAYDGEGRRDVSIGPAGEDTWEPPTDIPGLPEDISSKLRQGPANPKAELDAMIGLAGVKEQIRQMRNRLEFSGGRASTGGSNVALLGDAGTGKTQIARILCGLYYQMGYIRHNHLVEVDGDYLKSPYPGQTGERVSAVVQYAMGGVLFIDEAYLLVSDKSGAGNEAVGVLLKAMEDNRDDLVVILAGYADPMTRLIMSNEGFKSRIRYTIEFPSYTPEELMEIMHKFMRDSEAMHGMGIAPDAEDAIRVELAREATRPGFGNARSARNALDALYDIHADRYMRGQETDRDNITLADAQRWLSKQADSAASDARQFMAANGIDSSIINVQELRGRTHAGVDDPEGALDALVGLDAVKRQVKDFEDQARFWRESGEAQRPAEHIALLGHAGTGKTTIVAILTTILYKYGYIRENRYVDISGDFLRGAYLGQTGKRTEATVSYALGGVLFIDEAYLLASSEDGTADQFGTEAVGVLINAMEKHRDDLVVILAGYPAQMADLFRVNPGLKSRVSTVIDFPDYTSRELCKIYQRMALADGFHVERSVWAPLNAACAEVSKVEDFGNARWVRDLVGHSEAVHIRRYSTGEVGEDARKVIGLEDVRQALAEMQGA